jgi:hypothetical protein
MITTPVLTLPRSIDKIWRNMGNIFEESIADIWQGERYQAFRQAFESHQPAKHCSQCGLNWSY